jgi:hypothetical protein
LCASGTVVDFRRIRRIGSGLWALAEHEFDLSRFNETRILKQGRFQRKFISEWMIDFGLWLNRFVYWRILKMNDFSKKLKFWWICDIHALFIRLVLFSHHSHSLSLTCVDLRLSVCIVGVVLYQRLFQFHQNSGLQQLKRKQLLDLCLSCGLRTALVCSMAIWLWVMCFLMRMEWFKSQIFVWTVWWSQKGTAVE